MRRLALAAATGLVLLAPGAQAATRALVVGINEYPGITQGGQPNARDLKGAVADANNMARTLVSAFGIAQEDIRLLTDAAASREGILEAFRTWLIEGTKPGDRVVFYFAGHGAQVEDATADEEDKFDEVLAPADVTGELDGENPQLSGYIKDDEIQALISELKGREVMFIADACHSGTITRGILRAREAQPAGPAGYSPVRTLTPYGPLQVSADFAELSTRSAHRETTRAIAVVAADAATAEASADAPKVVAWSAVGSAQLAMEDMEKGGSEGLFTNRFVKGVTEFEADLDKNGKVTGSELLAYLRNESDAYCKRFACPTGATPTLEAYPGYDGTPIVAKAEAPAEYEAAPKVAEKDTIPEPVGPAYAGEVTVSLASGPKVSVGGAITVEVASSIPGRLIILDVHADGTTVQLFPNKHSLALGTEELIAAGETRSLPAPGDPFAFTADEPDKGRIVALVVDPKLPIEDVTAEYLDFQPIPDGAGYGAEISREINDAVVYPTGSEAALEKPAYQAPYGRGEAAYEIVAY